MESRLDKERAARRQLEQARLAFEREFEGWIAYDGTPIQIACRQKTVEAFKAVQQAKADLRAAEAL
ncbi:MAG: hypothetical protein LC123_02430 [Burkholderiales bacterium]|nr:hypothetical protein [Burkholderiales bacterium]